jgi:hypothetical protein
MTYSIRLLAAVALGIALASSCMARADTIRTRHPAAAGHQIIVHPRQPPPPLTNGTGASVGSRQGFVLDTLNPPQRDSVQGTFVGQRGLDRLPNQYSLPQSNVPLFYLPQIF